MKNTLLFTFALVGMITSAQAETTLKSNSTLYIHAFRSPSIGLEYRQGNIGIHGGLYTTILGDDKNRSTEFLKVGATFYTRASGTKQELFGGFAYLRGNNRNYKDKDAGFIEIGTRFRLGKGFDARLGNGFLFAKDRKTRVNPTVGISFAFDL